MIRRDNHNPTLVTGAPMQLFVTDFINLSLADYVWADYV